MSFGYVHKGCTNTGRSSARDILSTQRSNGITEIGLRREDLGFFFIRWLYNDHFENLTAPSFTHWSSIEFV